MTRVIFSTWADRVIDNRGKPPEAQAAPPDFNLPAAFEQNKNISAFMGWAGFALFDEQASIIDLSRAYAEALQHYSCGKCYPCRVGIKIIHDMLLRIEEGSGTENDLTRLEQLARDIQKSSKCQVGQTGPIPILGGISYFRDEFLNAIKNNTRIAKQDYISHLTAPCTDACPVHLDIPSYVELVKERKLKEAAELLRERNALPGVCGKVCVRPCEFSCRRLLLDESICIKAIKRYIIEYEFGHGQPREFKRDVSAQPDKVAIVGAGPAGIAAAFYLGRKGHQVTIFEALPEGGGMAAVGIPDYRLPRDFLNYEIDVVKSCGVTIIYDTVVGKDITLQQLREQGFKALFLGVGAHESKKMGVDGEDKGYRGFIPGVVFLRNINLGKEVPLGERLVVVGGGNVAIDCVRSAVRLGFKDVRLLYRRSRAEMPADEVEIREAEEEGIDFHYLTLPTRLIAEDGAVKSVECIRMELGEPDASGRRRPVPVEGSEFIIETDVVISAIGQDSNLFFIGPEPIEVTKWGTIKVDEQSMKTSLAGVFSGGDCVTGPATLVEALAAGSDAALTIDQYLSGAEPELPTYRKLEKFAGAVKVFDKNEIIGILGGQPRPPVSCLPVEERIHSFQEVDQGLTAKTAVKDADRCLRCYRVALLALSL